MSERQDDELGVRVQAFFGEYLATLDLEGATPEQKARSVLMVVEIAVAAADTAGAHRHAIAAGLRSLARRLV